MKYPGNAKNAADKTEFCYRAQELLKDLHNEFVKWRDDGLTHGEWNRLPDKIKERFPEKFKISKLEWQQFHDEDFLPRSEAICNEITTNRAVLKQSTKFRVSIGELDGTPNLSWGTRMWNWIMG